jgi:ADP-ribosylglycohydrolase
MVVAMTTTIRPAARDSLRGLALGDGFGERWFHVSRQGGPQLSIAMIKARSIPAEVPWYYTDDTMMALSIVRVLADSGEIDPQDLATTFADSYAADAYRGYGYGMTQLLPVLREDPGNWATYAKTLFNGEGSLGNGSSMRVGPLGAWFCDDLDRVVEQAALSAAVTHSHPEGIAGAVAVAVAAALAASSRGSTAPDGYELLRRVADLTPAGVIRKAVLAAVDVPAETPAWQASDILGNGQRIRAGDTVPFALWSAAHQLDDLSGALWTTAEGLGDVDTTCAITASVVAARTGLDAIPQAWIDLCEPLPEWVQPINAAPDPAS